MVPISQSLKDKIQDINSLKGWCSTAKAEAMASLICAIKPKLCVELGIFGGRSLVAQGMALKEVGSGAIWGIDPWTHQAATEGNNDPENDKWWCSLDMDAIRNEAMDVISRHALWERVHVIVAKSQDCVGMFHDIDILHQDSNHSEEISCDEAARWLPHLRMGGYLWFDDADWKETQKAIRYVENYCVRVMDVGNCRLYQKMANG